MIFEESSSRLAKQAELVDYLVNPKRQARKKLIGNLIVLLIEDRKLWIEKQRKKWLIGC